MAATPPLARTHRSRFLLMRIALLLLAALPVPHRTVAAEDAQIAATRASHWAFRPVIRPPMPRVRDRDWARTPLDRFILARLEQQRLTPSPPADKGTLLRRLSFDLLGLPPEPEEIDAFLTDDAPDSTARLVDRLLASPRYGEHWGRHWLDVARYADNKGYVLFQDNNFPWSYTYRDYVIRSLNEDLPYDRFVLEQLAADKLPLGDDRRSLTAMGFLTLGSRFMDNTQDIIDDRIDVVTRGLLGLTVSCARCHDHKYDPVSARDYYALYGVFASCEEPLVPPLFEPPPATEAYREFATELRTRQENLDEYVEGKFTALVAAARTRVAEYLLAAHALKDRPPTDDFMLLADPNDLNPMMVVRYQTFLERTRRKEPPAWVIWHALAELDDKVFSSQAQTVVDQLIEKGAPHALVAQAFGGQRVDSMADAARIYGELLLKADSKRDAATTGTATTDTATTDTATTDTGATDTPAQRASTDRDLTSLLQVFHHPEAPARLRRSEITLLMLLPDRESQGERNKRLKAVEQFRSSGPAAPPRAMILEDLPEPTTAHVFLRGNPNRLGEEVPRRFLRVLTDGEPEPFREDGSGRLDLARRIIARDNPLTARVIVNRVWLWHFGRGLVETPSDFGLRSAPPSHPELLDWLSWNFVQRGWSLKDLHRQILLSATYAQASDARSDHHAVDPENLWLGRMNRRRLGFESARDALLTTAGRLETTVGGVPVRNIADPTGTRRTLYGYIDRLNLPGLYRTFDYPNPDATSPRRVRTTIPQQALFMMNHPLVQDCAKHLLERVNVTGKVDGLATTVQQLYRLAYGREPGADELEWAEQFLGDAETRPAVWQEFAQGLLMANEFVFVD